MDSKRLQNPAYFTKWGVLQRIHQMPHFNSHSGQEVSRKNASKGASNLCCEAIAFLYFPSDPCSPQKAKSFD